MLLRRFPAKDFQIYSAGGNLFATTIFVLVSAVIKISRVMRLPPGLALFRGLGGLAELPDSFWSADEHGCRGYMEWGFLSTTSHRETAILYSGAGEGRPLPMVLQMTVSSIDRGACIKDFSQYPGEVARSLTLARTPLRYFLHTKHYCTDLPKEVTITLAYDSLVTCSHLCQW
jgi:hypothetical protein